MLLQNEIPQQQENQYKVFESHRLNNKNYELSGYKLFEKMCAETNQDRRHRQEVLPQTELLEATRDDK